MVKYREILRLRALGISIRGIAHSCGCSPTTVGDGAHRGRGVDEEEDGLEGTLAAGRLGPAAPPAPGRDSRAWNGVTAKRAWV